MMLIKLPLIQYSCNVKSMRQTIKECEVNVAYRWFLGLELKDPISHFSTSSGRFGGYMNDLY
ncbi:transposase [Lactococcus lactis]|nr:transposase [Lactococcus lactis]